MDAILYSAMNGAFTDFNRQAIAANNLANINTPGFKADLFNAQTMYLTVQGQGLTGQAMTQQSTSLANTSPGSVITTGRDLDVTVDGEGWLAVQDNSGKEAYIRGGSFRINENGTLLDASGHQVLGDGGPIAIPPAQRVEIGYDGTISIVPLDANPNEIAVLDRLKLVKVNPTNLIKNEEGLLVQKNGGQAEADASVKVLAGAIEGSNVNAVEEMTQMIQFNREYETQMKTIQTVDENGRKLAQLLQEE